MFLLILFVNLQFPFLIHLNMLREKFKWNASLSHVKFTCIKNKLSVLTILEKQTTSFKEPLNFQLYGSLIDPNRENKQKKHFSDS